MDTILPKKVFYPSYEDVKPSKSEVWLFSIILGN